tara:strand:- start:41 stop:466 length:426 start_codon:yes stop_codon:yes gene_type:complete
MKMNYDKMIQQIRSDEGEKLKVYRCSEGYLTIGVGRNLETNGISKDEAEYLLMNDLANVEQSLNRHGLLIGDHNDARKAVLYNMCLQLGITGLLKFHHTIAAFQAEDYRQCAEEMMDSRWALQTPKRAKRLSDQMLTGEWQ